MVAGEPITGEQLEPFTAWEYPPQQPNNHQHSIDISAVLEQQKVKELEDRSESLMQWLRSSREEVEEMKNDLQSLIDSCKDENCEGKQRCMQCQLIKSWIKPEIDPSKLEFGQDDE